MRPLALCLCLLCGHALAQARVADRIVATVNLHAVTRSALDARLKPLWAAHVLKPEQRAKAERQALDALIDDLLIADEAAHLGLEASDEDVERALKDVADNNQLTVAQLLEAAQQQGFEPEAYRAELRRQLTAMRWVRMKAPPMKADAGEGDLGRWLETERARLLEKMRADAVIEVRL